MSLDLYPALDAGEIEVAVALERRASAGRVAPLGAASLLYQNSEEYFPEEVGHDLISRVPRLAFENLATDGATIGDVFGEQLSMVEASEESVLLTLTVGQSDVFSATTVRSGLRGKIAADIIEAFDFLVETLRSRFPNGLLIVTTVCDPSDGTSRIPGVYDDAGPLPIDMLRQLNDHIRAIGQSTPNVLLADAHATFLGHGVTAADADRWYWKRSLTELNARGASELRLLWLDAIDTAEQT